MTEAPAADWPAVLALARVALLYSGDAPEVRRRIGGLKNGMLRRASVAGEGSRRIVNEVLSGQANELGALLERSAARTLPERGERPTRATAERARLDAVSELQDAGLLLPAHADAAHEIREVFSAVTAGMFASAGTITRDKLITRTRMRRYVDPIARLDARLARLWDSRYKPWANRMSKRYAARGNVASVSVLELVVALVVDGRTLGEIGVTIGVGRDQAVKALVWGLDDYARAAGWIKGTPEPRGAR